MTNIDLTTLCNYDSNTNTYVSKSGNDYILALSNLYELKNKNDKPFTKEDILQQPTLNDFTFSGVQEFQYICELYARPMTIKNGKRTNEKIITQNMTEVGKNIFNHSAGVVYMITCNIDDKEYIIKIGQSQTTFKKRLGSYNCGTVSNWRTASTTNIKILQSLLTNRLPFKLYIYDCSDDVYKIVWNGIESVLFASSKSLAVEDIMIKQFIKMFNKKPLANIQADASRSA